MTDFDLTNNDTDADADADAEQDADDSDAQSPTVDVTFDFSSTVKGDCPHCDRSETFGDYETARAWLLEHIRFAHYDELPSYD